MKKITALITSLFIFYSFIAANTVEAFVPAVSAEKNISSSDIPFGTVSDYFINPSDDKLIV